MYDLLIPLMVSKCAYNSGHNVEGMHATKVGLSKNRNNLPLLHNEGLYKARALRDANDRVAASMATQPQLAEVLATRRRSIMIYTGYSMAPWSPVTYQTSSLGGSETAAMWLAHSFAARGHNVSVTGGVTNGIPHTFSLHINIV
jgi:hypothetical protein